MNRIFKSRILRHLPGELGRRYAGKFMIRTSGFEMAIRCSQGMTCIDLGANLGVYTRKMALGTKQVIAFEPDPWTIEKLRAKVSDLDNVRIENAAAGTTEGMVPLYRHLQFERQPFLHSESSSIIVNKSNVTENGAVEVRQLDFIHYLETLDEDIGVLKIDIEGAEVDLLEALFDRPDILSRINCIFAETHEKRIPSHRSRVKSLRARAHKMEHPYINLY